jgi:AcrR family transcriptional regulator
MKVREPIQKRSKKTAEKIMDSARELFLSKGIQGTSSNEIAAHAGVSIGSFYSYYKDKDQLFREILSEIKDTGILKSLKEL